MTDKLRKGKTTKYTYACRRFPTGVMSWREKASINLLCLVLSCGAALASAKITASPSIFFVQLSSSVNPLSQTWSSYSQRRQSEVPCCRC